ncbi:MAG: site-2 protease family protein [Candidatus Eisenbacteria bacterium]
MRWSFRLVTLAGIRIEVHVTFLLMVAGLALFQSDRIPMWLTVSELLLVFLCVLLHELGHALAARQYGIPTREIVLLPIGGVARLERMPEKPAQEIVVALAGPGVNVILMTMTAAVLLIAGVPPGTIFERGLAVLFGAPAATAGAVNSPAQGGVLESLLVLNLLMLLFNLIPAFPMDGGRVLRAVLAMTMPYARATRIAAQVGQGFALLFAVAGVFVLRSPVMVFIALFVFMAAGEERALVQTRASLSGLPVSDAMVTAFVTLETRHELQHAIDLMLAGDQQDFPVLEGGRYLGMLARGELIKGLREEGPTSPVGRVVRLDVEPIDAAWPLERALQVMRAGRHSAVPVVRRGELVGLLTLENVSELLMVQEARQRHAGVA